MDDRERFELCVKEVELTQEQISRYDSNGLTIKSWCLATCSALCAYAVVHRSAFVAAMSAFVAIAFGGIELVYRCFQSRFIARAAALERVLADDKLSSYSYALSSSATKAAWARELLSALSLPHFWLFYALSGGFALLLLGALSVGWIPTLPNPW